MCNLDKLLIKSIIANIKSKKDIYKYFNFTYHTQKHTLQDILKHILFIMRTGLPWIFIRTISHKTVYKVFRKLCYFKIFKSTYIDLLEKYIKKSPANKLNVQLMDSTFIRNKKGSECIGRNKYYKNKNVTKMSLITDSVGIPINMKLETGNKYDSDILFNQLNSYLISNELLKNHNKYILGDKGYCSQKLRNKLRNNNYIPIIAFNKRNTKDISKIKHLSDYDKKIYNTRVNIEYTFGKIKRISRRVDTRYDKLIKTYENFVYLSFIQLINS